MSKRPTTTGPEVDAYDHAEAKRRNIPTAENQGLVPDDEKALKTLRYRRNPDLDPQLVWRGKDKEDEADLEVQAPPIYIQEKIKPEALIADLKRRAKAQQPDSGDPQTSFFHDFNGLPEGWQENAPGSYYHDEGNWSNRMILGDSLLVMGSLDEREKLRGQVQMIYVDPPYGIAFNSNWQPSTKSRDVKDNRAESISTEPEVIRAFRDTWGEGVNSYLSYLRDRFMVARELLRETGSIFVQIGDENVHRVRAILDEIFGDKNFVSQIQYRALTPLGSRGLSNVYDYILWFAKDKTAMTYRNVQLPRPMEDEPEFTFWDDGSGHFVKLKQTPSSPNGVFKRSDLKSSGYTPTCIYDFDFRGSPIRSKGRKSWRTNKEGMERLKKANRLFLLGSSIYFRQYFADSPMRQMENTWTDTAAGFSDTKVYVVQTHDKVITRCMLMTTDPGDLVLDPTCGSGTTAFVAERWGRRWITIDTSRVALALARTRLMSSKYDWYLPRDSAEGAAKESELIGKPVAPPPTDHKANLCQGFIYERVPRVTLGDIANNVEIDVIWDKFQERLEPLRERLNAALGTSWQEWEVPRQIDESVPAGREKEFNDLHAAWWAARLERQSEIDASIARGAEVEFLYDRPYKAKGVVRVAGPFTVESLSPHRVLPLEEDPVLLAALEAEDGEADGPLHRASHGPTPRSGEDQQTDFAQVVYENLKAAGVQNSRKGEAIKFEWLKPFASRKGYVAFEGRYLENGVEKRAAVAVGPEYDTVGYEFVRRAAREAADLFDTLIVCGFAFAPEVDESRLNFGGLTVLKARMNQDLRMGDKLKATGAGNLFVVFGEPDIAIEPAEDDMIRIRIKGVDIFDPTSGEVRSSDDPAEDIACWFIDDDYDEESFFVRQAYFLGRDPYESLKRALKAEIDEAAWAELNSTVSRTFPRPKSGRVCVKVINHFGDEVQKVFTV
ncbi:MAG: adenine-specific DNA-methyltransferase [Sphingomonadales bacterium]|nr:adenine-specific DNA-methyltransferase [Sphingomonadales bacterium]